MSVGAPGPWRKVVMYERSVLCPRSCGYMAVESWREGADRASGVCTKCGHFWSAGPPKATQPHADGGPYRTLREPDEVSP